MFVFSYLKSLGLNMSFLLLLLLFEAHGPQDGRKKGPDESKLALLSCPGEPLRNPISHRSELLTWFATRSPRRLWPLRCKEGQRIWWFESSEWTSKLYTPMKCRLPPNEKHTCSALSLSGSPLFLVADSSRSSFCSLCSLSLSLSIYLSLSLPSSLSLSRSVLSYLSALSLLSLLALPIFVIAPLTLVRTNKGHHSIRSVWDRSPN